MSGQSFVAESDRPFRLGRYLVFGELGRGGMARVHLARQLGAASFTRLVALKRLHEGVPLQGAAANELIDEARVSARVRHPNVVSVSDVERTETELALAMDYVHGPSLAWLAHRARSTGAPIPRSVALRVAVDTLRGLGAAHAAVSERGRPLELVHRDVSPQNVLVGDDGLARIADFGIAKALGRLTHTRHGILKGKLIYMAPEQLRLQTVDRRADLYAMGVVLWELVAGRSLFQVPDIEDRILRHLELRMDPLPSVAEFAHAPPELAAAIARALDPTPDGRFADASEMVAALERADEVATNGQVAAWLREVARDLLDERAEVIERVESLSVSGPDLAASPPAAPATLVEGPPAHSIPTWMAMSPLGEREATRMITLAVPRAPAPVAPAGSAFPPVVAAPPRPSLAAPPEPRGRGSARLSIVVGALLGALIAIWLLVTFGPRAYAYVLVRRATAAAAAATDEGTPDPPPRPGRKNLKKDRVELDGVGKGQRR